MCEIFLIRNVFVGLYAIRSNDQISIGNCRWKCGNCPRLNRVVELECVCCAEIDCVVAKNSEAVGAKGLTKPPIWIRQHPGFHAVYLNQLMLRMAWYQYKQDISDIFQDIF